MQVTVPLVAPAAGFVHDVAFVDAAGPPADCSALAGTDGFVELPPGPNTYAKGFVTRLYRWA